MTSRTLKVLVALGFVFILSSPVFMTITRSQSQPGTTLSIGEIFTPPENAMNPFNPTSDYSTLGFLYDYMFSMNWPPLPYITNLMAGGYSSNAAYDQWVVSLRSNLKWSDGTPLNSTDLMFTLGLYNQSGYFSPAFTKLTILNSTSVQVNLASGFPDFIHSDFIGTGFAVLPKETFGKVAFSDLSSFQNLNNLVTSGPFAVVGGTITDQNPIVLQANPYYWNGAPKVQTLKVYQYTSQSSYFDAYIAGQIDALAYFGAYTGLQSVINLPGHTLVVPPQATPGCTAGAYLNAWRYPTNLTAFRQALAYATNVTQINNALNGPYASNAAIAQDWLLPAYNQQIGFSTSGPQGYTYDIAKAKQILQSAGFKYSGNTLEYPNGTAVTLTIKFRPTTEPYSAPIATLLTTQWSQLGIAVTPISVPSATLRAGANNASGWQVIATSVLGPQTNFGVTPGPTVLADLGDYYVNQGGNHVSWNSTYFNTITRMAGEAQTSDQFKADARLAATMLVQGVPSIPFFNIDNWGSVNNNFYWGNPANFSGIFHTQAITQFTYWALALDTIAPASATTTSTTSSSTPTTSSSSTSVGSTTSSSSSTTTAAASTDNTLLYAAVVVVAIVVIAAVVLVARRRK